VERATLYWPALDSTHPRYATVWGYPAQLNA